MKKAILFLTFTAMISCGGDSFVIPAPIGGGTNSGPDQEEPAPPGPEDLPGWPLVRQGEGTLVADGDDAGTYALIVAQGYNQEAPDTSGDHAKEPFRHIRQVFDQELKRWVFDFLRSEERRVGKECRG